MQSILDPTDGNERHSEAALVCATGREFAYAVEYVV